MNIYGAKYLRDKALQVPKAPELVHDRVLLTWFPAFRANYEVAQITEGKDVLEVLRSAVRVRFWVSLAMAGIALLVPLVFDINNLTDDEGFITIAVVAIITLAVGVRKLRVYMYKD